MRPILCGGVRYESIRECVDRTDFSVRQLQYALEVTGHIGVVSIEYADDPADSIVAVVPEVVVRMAPAQAAPLLPRLCTHRLGVHHGGRY